MVNQTALFEIRPRLKSYRGTLSQRELQMRLLAIVEISRVRKQPVGLEPADSYTTESFTEMTAMQSQSI